MSSTEGNQPTEPERANRTTQAPPETVAARLWRDPQNTLLPQSMREQYTTCYDRLSSSDSCQAEKLKRLFQYYDRYTSGIVQSSIDAENKAVSETGGSLSEREKSKRWAEQYMKFRSSTQGDSCVLMRRALEAAFDGNYDPMSVRGWLGDIVDRYKPPLRDDSQGLTDE